MFQRVAHIWRDLPIPVVAVVHGKCFGGGMQIILACDYRIATPTAKLSILEMNWGLIPDMSAMVTLSRLTQLRLCACRNQRIAMHNALNRDAKPRPFRNRTIFR